MPRILALLDIVKYACAGEKKTFSLPLASCFFGIHLLLRIAATGSKRFDLTFNRLAFPTSSHNFIVGLSVAHQENASPRFVRPDCLPIMLQNCINHQAHFPLAQQKIAEGLTHQVLAA